MKLYFKSTLVLVFCFHLQLVAVGNNCKTDSCIIKYANKISYVVPDSAILLLEELIANENFNDSITFVAYEILGNAYWYKGLFIQSIERYRIGHKYAKSMNSPDKISRSYSNMGYLYMELGDYERSVEQFKIAMDIALKHNLEHRYFVTTSYLAAVLGRNMQIDKAIKLQLKLYNKSKAKNDSASVGILANNMASNYQRARELDSALYYYNIAIQIDKNLNRERDYANSMLNVSEIYFTKENYSKALESVNIAIDIYKKYTIKSSLALSYSTISKIHAHLKDFDLALSYANQSLEAALQTGSKRLLADAYGQLSSVQKKWAILKKHLVISK